MAARTRWTEQDAEAFEALARRLVERAADIEDRFPLGGLTAADRDLLVDGFDWVELDGDDLIRRWAQAIGSRPDLRSIDGAHKSLANFRRQGNAKRRARVAQAENALEVAEAAMKRRNRPSARGLPDGIDPEAMINSGSQTLMALGYLLRDRPGRLWYDDFYRTIRLDWAGSFDTAKVEPYEINDAAILRIMIWLRSLHDDLGSASNSSFEDAIKAAADADHRNEPADWLKSLEWDGKERLNTVLHRVFGASPTAFNRDVGRNFFVGLVARILKPGIKLDTMMVLRGGQGLNKSTALKIIGGKWYAQSHANVDSKDFIGELKALMLLEIQELHSFVASKTGNARIKAMLSTEEDRYRPVWGRTVQTFPRTLSIAGSTNDQHFHNDPTGGRRFNIVDIPKLIDLVALKADRDQLFAEAVKLFKDGASWWEVPEEEHMAMLESASATTYFQEFLEERLASEQVFDGSDLSAKALAPSIETSGSDGAPLQWGNLLTLRRIAHWMNLSPRDVETGYTRARLVESLRSMGFETKKFRVVGSDKSIRPWLRIMPETLKIIPAPLHADRDDLPF